MAVLKYGVGYFDEIKERNADEFVSMSVDAGASVERGVYAAGLVYEKGKFSIGAIDYYSDDIINIAYAETKMELPFSADWKPRLPPSSWISAVSETTFCRATVFRPSNSASKRSCRSRRRCLPWLSLTPGGMPTCRTRGAVIPAIPVFRFRTSTGPARMRSFSGLVMNFPGSTD